MSDEQKKTSHVPGPTGEYPRGSLSSDDMGQLKIQISLIPETESLVLEFGTSVEWLGFGKEDATDFANLLLAAVEQLEVEVAEL